MDVSANMLRELYEILDACVEVDESDDEATLSTANSNKLDRLRAEVRELWLKADRQEADCA